jgi:hypothetical protein
MRVPGLWPWAKVGPPRECLLRTTAAARWFLLAFAAGQRSSPPGPRRWWTYQQGVGGNCRGAA